MDWKKTKLTTYLWEAPGFEIREAPESEGRRYALTALRDLDAEPLRFTSLDDAKRHAKTLNELELFRQENARLRADLAQQRGVWPSEEEAAQFNADEGTHADETEIEPEQPARHPAEDCGPDGRGIPKVIDPWFDKAPQLALAPADDEADMPNENDWN